MYSDERRASFILWYRAFKCSIARACERLRKSSFCLSAHQRRSSFSVFCKILKFFLQIIRFDCLGKGEMLFLLPLYLWKTDHSAHFLQACKNFSYKNDRSGCIGITRFWIFGCSDWWKTHENLFMASRYINSAERAVFLQEIWKIFYFFINLRHFEHFSCLSTVITLEILVFYTFFKKSWNYLSGRLGLLKRAFQVLSIIQWEILSKISSSFENFSKNFFDSLKSKEKSRYRGVCITLW